MSDYELKRINALTEASAINDSDVFAIDSAAGTKKVAWETLKGEVDAVISEAVSNKADKDGTYPDMAVGSVLGTNTVTDKEPYFLRPSASIGDREFDTLVGGSLGWNQLAHNFNYTTMAGVEITQWEDGINLNGTSTEDKIRLNDWGTDVSPNHVYLTYSKNLSGDMYLAHHLNAIDTFVHSNGYALIRTKAVQPNPKTAFYLYADTGTEFSDLKIYPQLIDLTTLFGATIADYIYSLETATAGAGVAWVRKYLPNDYYAYCAPTLKHVSGVSAHVMRDANNNIIGNYPIDSTWTGMGIPKLDSANKLYFDGDTYASDGTVTERFGIVDLGDQTWYYGNGAFQSDIPTKAIGIGNLICAKYPTYTATASLADMPDKMIKGQTNGYTIYVKDSAYTSSADFKTAMSGVYLVYEKATPTASTASPYTSPQICDPDGTEEYVTTGLVPVGHETEYVENLADKLTDIPDLPTTEGTYSLEVTVSGGVPSYSWVSA